MTDYTSTVPQDAIEELNARFSALAAEIAQDDRPEPEPPTSGGAAVKRSKYDGLTGEERQQLYDATAYFVLETGEKEWTVSHNTVPAVFKVRGSGKPGIALVESNTGHEHEVDAKHSECGCPDAKRKEERGDGRPCKHLAVVKAVVLFHRRQKEAEEAARVAAEAAREAAVQRKHERNRARLAPIFEAFREQYGLSEEATEEEVLAAIHEDRRQQVDRAVEAARQQRRLAA